MTDKIHNVEESFDISDKSSKTAINKTNKKKQKESNMLSKNVLAPLWLSVSESAKIGGVTPKTIRRALQGQKLTYKILKNRYLIDLRSVIKYLHTNKKLKNKLLQNGIGQYIDKWRE